MRWILALLLVALPISVAADPIWNVAPQNPGIAGTPGFSTAGSAVAGQFTSSFNGTYEFILQNTSNGANASTDFIATSNDGTETTHYADFGINGSAGGAAPFTAAHEAYIYNIDAIMDVGALGTSGAVKFWCGGGVTPTACGILNGTGLALPQTGNGALNIGASTANAPFTLSTNSAATLPAVIGVGMVEHIVIGDSVNGGIQIDTASAQGRPVFQSSAGTIASPTILGNAAVLGQHLFYGYQGSSYYQAVAFVCSTAEPWINGTNEGSSCTLQVTPNGTVTKQTALTVSGESDTIGNHLASTQPGGTLPTVASCGTGSPTVTAGSTDTRGSVTTGTAATACTITFKGTPAFATAPFCTVSDNSLASFSSVTSVNTTTLVLGLSAALTGGVVTWICIE